MTVCILLRRMHGPACRNREVGNSESQKVQIPTFRVSVRSKLMTHFVSQVLNAGSPHLLTAQTSYGPIGDGLSLVTDAGPAPDRRGRSNGRLSWRGRDIAGHALLCHLRSSPTGVICYTLGAEFRQRIVLPPTFRAEIGR